MNRYQVIIIETAFITEEVEASSKPEAIEQVKKRYRSGELSSSFEDTDAEFEAERIG